MTLSLLNIELIKIFKKWRSYIGFIAVFVLTLIVQTALYFEGENYLNMATRSIQQSFVFSGNLMNGYLVGYLILQTLFIHIPFLIVLVGGDLLAGEATGGTYRILVSRPVSRSQIVFAKFSAGLIYTNLLLVVLFIVSLVLSSILYGTGELIVLRDKIYIFASDDVVWRFLLAYGYATLSMTTVLAVSFLFSSLVENAIGPIVATMALIIIFIIISALPIDALENVRPFLFTTHMDEWRLFFGDPVDFDRILKSAGILLAHIFGLYFITLWIFKKKDILS